MNTMLLVTMLLLLLLEIAILLRPPRTVVKKVNVYVKPSEQVGEVDVSDELWHLARRAYEYGARVSSVADATLLFGNDWYVRDVTDDGVMLIATDIPPYGYEEAFDADTTEVGEPLESSAGDEPASGAAEFRELGRVYTDLGEQVTGSEPAWDRVFLAQAEHTG